MPRDRGRRRRARRVARRTGRAASLGVARLPLLPPAQDRHDRRGRRGHDGRRELADAVRAAPPPRLVAVDEYADMPAAGRSTTGCSDVLCALGIPQLRRLDELLAAYERIAAGLRRAARAASTSSFRGATRATVHGWQAYVIQLDRRDEVHGAPARAGHPVPDRDVRAAPARRLSRPGRRSPAPTPPSSGRSRCRSTRGSPSRSSTAWREALDKLVSHH